MALYASVAEWFSSWLLPLRRWFESNRAYHALLAEWFSWGLLILRREFDSLAGHSKRLDAPYLGNASLTLVAQGTEHVVSTHGGEGSNPSRRTRQ